MINIGPKRGAKIKRRWDPKEWRPEYEAIVALSCTGIPQGEIAKRYGYTEPWVSMIINSDKGKIVKELIKRQMRERVLGDISGDRIRKLQLKAFQRVEDAINNDDIAISSPMAIFDRSMDILKKTNIIGVDHPNPMVGGPAAPINSIANQTNIQVNIAPGEKKELNASLKLADDVRKLHSVEVK